MSDLLKKVAEFIFERADGSTRKVAGYQRSQASDEIQEYEPNQYEEDDLPKKVDLRSHMTEIEDQDQTNSCVANSVAGAYEYVAKKHTGEDYDVSRMFIYYNGRCISYGSSEDMEDEGCSISGAIEGLKEHGACSEETYPFDLELVNEEPPEEAYAEAAEFKVEDMVLVPTTLFAWKHALAEGHPIIFGLNLYDSFDKQKKKGLVPMPTKQEKTRAEHGGHAMLAVGYSDKDEVFIVRNSWGTGWGDKGYCYIPYAYMMDEAFNDGDSWIIRQLDNTEFDSESNWSDDDESVMTEAASEFDNMDDETYEEMLDAMGDVSFEYRLGLVFLYGANADGDLSDEEYEEIGSYLEQTLEAINSDQDATKILRNAAKDVEDQELIEESVELFGQYFSKGFLAKIIHDIEQVIGVDDLSEEESEFIQQLVQIWQVGEAEEDVSEEEEEDTAEEDEDDEE